MNETGVIAIHQKTDNRAMQCHIAIRIFMGKKQDKSNQFWCILKTMLVSLIIVPTTGCIFLICGELIYGEK